MAALDVSILVCAHNRLDLTRRCLTTLQETLPTGLSSEVLFYDDQSTDGTVEYLRDRHPEIAVFQQQERGFFAANMNCLARSARGRWLCLLNNDTVLRPDWLSAMLDLAAREPRANVIGNYQRFPQTQRVNHAGIVFDSAKDPKHLYLGMPDTLACTFESRPFQCVTAACWLVHADLHATLGGLDEEYRNGCEDLDFCFKTRQLKREVWYCGASRIDHYGQSTPGRMRDEDSNLGLFHRRWDSQIEADLEIFTKRDGQAWPAKSIVYRLLHGAWRVPAMSSGRRLVMQSALGRRLRQQILAILHHPST
jgi:GT2 family glycosyltransferase